MPAHVFALSKLLHAAQPDPGRVRAVFESDPSLSVQLLRIANSPYVRPADPVWSIERALGLLGKDQLRTLILTCSLAQNSHRDDRLADPHTIWHYSAMTARLSLVGAKFTGYAEPELAFVAGLLHNVGKIPLMLLEGENATLPVPHADSEPGSLEWEMGRYGMDHCEIGRSLGVAWNLPPVLIDAVEFHHHPEHARKDRMLVGLVAAASEFCTLQNLGYSRAQAHIDLQSASAYLTNVQRALPGLSLTECARLAGAFEQAWLEAAHDPAVSGEVAAPNRERAGAA